MIITKTEPFTKNEVEKLKEEFGDYIKTVIDMRNKICSAGMNRHFEGEQILLDQGSRQCDIWGGGMELTTGVIDYNSFINIRPQDDNRSDELLDNNLREKYKQITEYFFSCVL